MQRAALPRLLLILALAEAGEGRPRRCGANLQTKAAACAGWAGGAEGGERPVLGFQGLVRGQSYCFVAWYLYIKYNPVK